MKDMPEPIVREHARARRVILRVLAGQGLVVTVPKGFSRADLARVLARRQTWIEAALERLQEQGLEPGARPARPESVTLAAVAEAYAVRPGQAQARPGLRLAQGELVLSGPAETHLELLRAWLRRHAKDRLLPWLAALSRTKGLPFAAAQFRLQRSRWGSCSARGGISLNAKLLFLPPDLAGHVMLHELAHTRHMNHSPAYWRFLGRLEPRTPALERALRSAWTLVPAWAC